MTIVLTFDTDWMLADWMHRFEEEYDSIPESTFFVHSKTGDWRPQNHAVGPHPTISSLDSPPVIPADLHVAGVRTHTCVSSHMLSLHWAKAGFQYESNTTRFLEALIQPTQTPWGIWELPIFYMDNIDLCLPLNWRGSGHEPLEVRKIVAKVSPESLSVFDFHPLHIALNTRSYADYQSKKEKIQRGVDPWTLASPGHGVRDVFEYLIDQFQSGSFEVETAESVVDNLKSTGSAGP